MWSITVEILIVPWLSYPISYRSLADTTLHKGRIKNKVVLYFFCSSFPLQVERFSSYDFVAVRVVIFSQFSRRKKQVHRYQCRTKTYILVFGLNSFCNVKRFNFAFRLILTETRKLVILI